MNKELYEIIRAVNFLKGIIANFDNNKNEELIFKFIETHSELIPHFEKANVLSFGLRNNEHTKQLTNIFLETNYSVNQDKVSSFIACKYNHLKSVKIILDKGFDINNEHNGKIIIEELLDKISLRNSNKTIKKVNKIISELDLDQINHDKFIQLTKNIENAKINLLKMKTFNSNLMYPIIEQFEDFEKLYKITLQKKSLDRELNKVEKTQQQANPKKFKI